MCRGGSIWLLQEGPLTAQGGFKLRMERQWQGRQQQKGAPSRQHLFETELFFQPQRQRVGTDTSGSRGGDGSMPSVTHFVPPGLVCLETPVSSSSHVSMLFYAVPVRYVAAKDVWHTVVWRVVAAAVP